jgi:hypothetical protein
MRIHADPDPGYTLKTKISSKSKIMLNFNENKVTINSLIPITVIFILFMPNYLSFGCVFFYILALFKPPGSGSAFGMDPDPNHCT